MKTRILFILACIAGMALPGNGQSLKTGIPSYEREWKKVDSLSELGLPKSALAIVNRIYSEAKKNNNEPQSIRAVIYRLKFLSETRENASVRTLVDLKKEINITQGPAKQILISILGEGYWRYYQSNRYRLQERSQVLNNISDSIETWDLTTLSDHIIKTYLHSLANPDKLKSISLKGYETILNNPGGKFRPTLYDFLAWRALDFFQSNDGPKVRPVNAFRVNDPLYFSPAWSFIRIPLQEWLKTHPSDSMTLEYHAICLYKELAVFHNDDKDPGVFIDNELQRLKFVYNKFGKSDPAGTDSLYLDALTQLGKKYESSPWSTDISFAEAGFLNDRGQQYKPLESDRYKWDIRQAYSICSNAIERYPESDGAKNCKILAENILLPVLKVNTENAILPGKPSPASVEFRNITSAGLRWIAMDPEKFQEKVNTLSHDALMAYLTSLPADASGSVNLPSDGDYQTHRIEISLPPVNPGFYILLLSSDPSFQNAKAPLAYCNVFATRISEVSYRSNNGSMEYYILDRDSGIPMEKVKAELFSKFYNNNSRKYETRMIGEFQTDANGYFRVIPSSLSEGNPNYYMRLSKDEDYIITGNFYNYYYRQESHPPALQTWFFTDRAIYRPGQVVYFKGIMLERNGDEYSIKKGVTTNVVFNDANGQKVAEKEFTTNEFGSFNGSFMAPTGVLAGQMTLSNGSGSVSVSVEEYKRPTFEVTFNPVEGNYRLGDSVRVTGKAMTYAGSPVDGAKVNFRVIRSARFPFWGRWWCPFPVSPEVEIEEGSALTLADGSFSLRFRAIPDPAVDRKADPVFAFRVTADVTDQNGETRHGDETVSAGFSSLLIGINVPDKLNPEKDTSFILTTSNLAGRRTPAEVSLAIQRLQRPERIFRKRMWERPDLAGMSREEFYSRFPNDVYDNDDDPSGWPVAEKVLERSVNTGTDTVLSFPSLKSGKEGVYLLTLDSRDPFGQKVERKIYFTLYSPSSKEVPGSELNWFVPLKTQGEPGEKARFLIGSKEQDVRVIYEIRLQDTLVSREWLKLSNSQAVVEIPIREKYRGNFAVNFIFVKHGRAFQNISTVIVPYTNKKLDIAFQTFRDKLYPGQDEEWKIRISNAAGKGVKAEMLASMYDASLDVFAPNSWDFSLYRSSYYYFPWDISDGFRQSSGAYNPVATGPDYLYHTYEQLNYFGLELYSGSRFYRGSGVNRILGVNQDMAVMPAAAAKSTEASMEVAADTSGGKKPVKNIEKISQPVQIRKDFRETAFFYPSLVTDSTGNLLISFKVPESLTQWKIMGLATTTGLDYGYVEKELVTRKDLMVFPNAPRFVRQGDTLIFSAKVTNMSDRALAGNITLEWVDAITQKPVDLIDRGFPEPMPETGWSFNLPLGQSTAFRWRVIIPVDPSLSLVTYRIVARAGNFSDGEEKAIPVLTNRMLVTETLPLPVRGQGKFNFHFDRLVKSGWGETVKNYRLTLEFTSNPAWYAVQALPSLEEPQYPGADNIFRSFYANSIASFIANSDPRIRQVFESWKNLTPDALLSNLEKNQQLKTALLQETPWVVEARSESQQKQRIAALFDMNTMSVRLDENLRKLKKMQLPGGAWPWFDGMMDNRYITQNIVTGLGHLDHLGVRNIRDDKTTWDMLARAVHYLDGQIERDYELIKKYPGKMNENHLGPDQIQYLYSRSYFMKDIPLDKSSQKAFDYYRSQAEKYWIKNDLCFQGMISLALNRLGNKTVPVMILRSLSEKALHSPEMGMYWASVSGYEWFSAPVETQALLIEAYDEVLADRASVDEMKIWLLKQKQTQNWKTGRATAEACYALLLRGTGLLSTTPDVVINLGNEKIDPKKLIDQKVEAGTGYFQVSWNGREIRPDMGNVTISKSGEGIAWGAVYWQYFENLDKITFNPSAMRVEKKIFLEKNTPSGPVLTEIGKSSGEVLHTGDKLKVRIVLTADRSLEYVHLKDMRASALEPVVSPAAFPKGGGDGEGLSGYRYQDGLGYYQSTTDLATNFFFDYLPKGTYVFEYPLVVNAAGEYSNGIATVQCLYAPEFSAHTEGIRIFVK